MAYSHVLTRCWLKVRKLWLNFIMHSTSTMLNKPKISFFRDEYQPECGNLSHIHGLLALQRGDMENTEFVRFVCSLQKNSVMDLVSTKEVDGLVQKRLIRDDYDCEDLIATTEKILSHTCSSRRCLVKTGPNPHDYYCKKFIWFLEVSPHWRMSSSPCLYLSLQLVWIFLKRLDCTHPHLYLD